MHVSKIKYGRSFQLSEGHWEKIGIEIDLGDTDTVENARVLAKELVEDIYQKNNPQLPLTAFQPGLLPIIDSNPPMVFDDEIQDEYKYVEQQINLCQDQQSADAILKASTFRYNIQLKNLVNSKPIKNN